MQRMAVLTATLLTVSACTENAMDATVEPSRTSHTAAPLAAAPSKRAPQRVQRTYEGCAALASYLAGGGSSHDNLYDPEADVLVVYSATGSHQFRLSVEDAVCIRRSPEIAMRVRDSIQTHQAHLGPEFDSRLLELALRNSRR